MGRSRKSSCRDVNVMSQNTYDVFHAIADPTRRSLLGLLSQGEKNISTLVEQFNVTRPAIAKHLKILRKSNLVASRKEGRDHIYSLHPEPLREVEDWIGVYRKFWTRKLSNLKRVVEDSQ